jgi:hypothetical protein
MVTPASHAHTVIANNIHPKTERCSVMASELAIAATSLQTS